tara:strand:- start:1094 stop:1285 length:192 start_codon:yes stop_codon:yes gene_type:complete
MDLTQVAGLSLEASVSLFIIVLAIKLYKCKLSTISNCFGDKLHIETSNPGSETSPMDGVLNKL